MATKAKESSTLGNERKKTPSSITTTKRTTKPSTTTTTSTTNKSNSTTPSEKNIPNYLKPTTSFKQLKTETPIKPSPLRRRSLDKPLSSSNLTATKQKETSLSRLHKALVSPGPRERSASLTNRSSNVPVKSTNPSKPISNKTPSDAKNKLVGKKVTNKSALSRNNSTSKTSKKVANDHASDIPVKIKAVTTYSDSSSAEIEDVKEVTNQEVEVIKVENEEYVSHEISSDVSSDLAQQHEHDQVLEDSDPPQNQTDDEKVISTVSDQEVEEKDSQEEEHEVEHEEKENNNGNQIEVNHSEVESKVSMNEKEENESGNQIEEADHSEVENEVSVIEKEENESGNQTEEVDRSEVESEVSGNEKVEIESGNQREEADHSEVESEVAVNEKEENESENVIEDKKSENNSEEEQGGEEKETVEGGVSEEVEEAKIEVAQPKQQQLAVKGKNDLSQVSNGMIEETASKLLGRKNKVLALAGAFQTVIDHQIK